MHLSPEQIEHGYTKVEQMLAARLGEKPSLTAITFLIGLQELGQLNRSFSKEEKQDLMHIGVCCLLLQDGYYRYTGRDPEGWPHFEKTEKIPDKHYSQELLLKKNIVDYFSNKKLNA